MKKDTSIDAKLVERYQSGDQVALAGLVKRWHLDFCRKAQFILKDPDHAKDVAQDTWRTIMIRINDLNDPKRFGPWALRIVYSKSLDVIRMKTKERKRQEVYSKDQMALGDAESPIDDNEAIKKELYNAILKLPIQQQHVVKLFYTENYTLKDIGELLEISVGTAKSRLFHAREKLKQHLKNRTYEN